MRSFFLRSILVLLFFGGNGVSLVAAQPRHEGVSSTLEELGQMTAGQSNAVIGSLGLSGVTSGFSLAKIIAWIIFGAVGFAAFVYGKKERSFKPLVVGIALMGYPYFINTTFWLYVAGVGLCLLLYFWRD